MPNNYLGKDCKNKKHQLYYIKFEQIFDENMKLVNHKRTSVAS